MVTDNIEQIKEDEATAKTFALIAKVSWIIAVIVIVGSAVAFVVMSLIGASQESDTMVGQGLGIFLAGSFGAAGVGFHGFYYTRQSNVYRDRARS